MGKANDGVVSGCLQIEANVLAIPSCVGDFPMYAARWVKLLDRYLGHTLNRCPLLFSAIVVRQGRSGPIDRYTALDSGPIPKSRGRALDDALIDMRDSAYGVSSRRRNPRRCEEEVE
jgi:hypothetical protein